DAPHATSAQPSLKCFVNRPWIASPSCFGKTNRWKNREKPNETVSRRQARTRSFGTVHCRPAVGNLGQRRFLPRHAFDRNRIKRDLVDTGKEIFRPVAAALCVFAHERREETLLDCGVFDNPCPAENDDAPKGNRGVALETAIGK